MRSRGVIILVSVAMILMVAGIGNAFASVVSWSGTDVSYADGNKVAHWSQTIPSTSVIYPKVGDQLNWDNVLYNAGLTTLEAQVSWAFSDNTPQGYARDYSLAYSQYWWPSPDTAGVASSGSHTLGANHWYTTSFTNDPGSNTGTNAQSYTASN